METHTLAAYTIPNILYNHTNRMSRTFVQNNPIPPDQKAYTTQHQLEKCALAKPLRKPEFTALTTPACRDKIATRPGSVPSAIHADVVELVDSLDLGSNAQACRFESCHPHQ